MSLYDPANNTLSVEESRAKLHAQFSPEIVSSATGQAAGWSKMWDFGKFLPFDRGLPNPALADTLSSHAAVFGLSEGPEKQQERKTALVPGCGRGYDVVLLSAYGYEAHGLEIAEKAAKSAVIQASHEVGAEKLSADSPYVPKFPELGRGPMSFSRGDFFAPPSDWTLFGTIGTTSNVPMTTAADHPTVEKYDLIYDYTFFCALPPVLRHRWAASVQRLLKPGGHLVCVEFPLTKPIDAGGPPWALRENIYSLHLKYPGIELAYDEHYNLLEEKSEEVGKLHSKAPGLVRVDRWKAEKTHDIGKGKDWVSIWQLAA